MRWWVWGLLTAIAVAVFLSPLASPWPDGLERVAGDKGFLEDAEVQQVFEAPIPDYALPTLEEGHLATAAVGLFGTVAAFGVALGVGRALMRKSKDGRTSRDGEQDDERHSQD